MVTIFSGGLWSLIQHADIPSKIILLILLGISILCWSLFLYILLRTREQRFEIRRFIQKILVSSDLAVITHHATRYDFISAHYAQKVEELLKTVGSLRGLDERGWELLQHSLQQRAEQLLTYNEGTSMLLSTSASIAPLLGLLGTVWGLVHSFMNIALTQSADITAVAPGIAEALITTIAGLLVAIPALVMYNITLQIHGRTRESMYELVDAIILLMHKVHQ